MKILFFAMLFIVSLGILAAFTVVRPVSFDMDKQTLWKVVAVLGFIAWRSYARIRNIASGS